MKFEQIVHRLTDQVIKAICQTHGKSDPTLAFLLDECWVEQCWQAMSEDERRVILFFITEKGKDILTYREMEQSYLPLSSVRFRLALTKLRRSGFIFTLRRMWGEQAYFMSPEQVELFGRQCVPESSDWKSQKQPPESISYHILDDLLQVLNVVRNASTPISLTKKGTLHKRDIKLLFQDTKVTKEMFVAYSDVVQSEQPFEIHEATILHVLLEWKLLKNQHGKLVLGNIEHWVNRDIEEIAEEFIEKLFLDQFDPKLSLLFNIIKRLDRAECYSVQAILRSMGDLAPSEEHVIEKCINPLADMGFIHTDLENGDTVFKWRMVQPMPNAVIYVQPNFEILLPAFTPLRTKWQIMQMATLISREEMWVFQLDSKSCLSYLESGKTVADVLAVLNQHSAVPIPKSVVSALEQWGKDLERVSFWDVRLLRVNQPELAEEFERIPAISDLLYEKIGTGCFIVRSQDSDHLAMELEKRGYRFGQVVNDVDRLEKAEDLSIPLLKNQILEIKDQIDSVVPAWEDMIPEWRQIPRMWVSHYSNYWESTMRQLIQQAIQIGLELKCESKGHDHYVHPIQLINKEGNWTMVVKKEDKGRLEYLLEDIAKIQIVSPF